MHQYPSLMFEKFLNMLNVTLLLLWILLSNSLQVDPGQKLQSQKPICRLSANLWQKCDFPLKKENFRQIPQCIHLHCIITIELKAIKSNFGKTVFELSEISGFVYQINRNYDTYIQMNPQKKTNRKQKTKKQT